MSSISSSTSEGVRTIRYTAGVSGLIADTPAAREAVRAAIERALTNERIDIQVIVVKYEARDGTVLGKDATRLAGTVYGREGSDA